jgi:uncharacterized protein
MIFLDTGFLAALVLEDDAQHERVVDAFEPYRGRILSQLIVTTNHILSETVTLIRSRAGAPWPLRNRIAIRVGEQMLAEAFGRLHHVTVEQERDAFAYLKKHSDKNYSFADCTSFVVMEQLGITEALTLDSHFTHRFTAIPGPRPK